MQYRFSNILRVLSVIFLVIGIFDLVKRLNNRPETNLRLILSPYGKYKRWIAAQAKHETGDYTSRLAIEQNNLFGMKCPKKRKHLGTCLPGNEYLSFKSRAESIRDYMLWLDYNNFDKSLLTVQDFVTHLRQHGYFTDSYKNYLAGVSHYLKFRS